MYCRMDTIGYVMIGILAIPVAVMVIILLGDLINMITAPLLYLGEQEYQMARPVLQSLRDRIRTFRGTAVPAGRQSRRAKDRARK